MVFTGFLPEANQINHQIRFSPLSLVLAEESLDYCSLALMAPAAPVAPDDHNIHGFFGLFGMIWNGDLLLIHLLLIKFWDELMNLAINFASFQISVLPGWVTTGDPRSQMV